MKPEELTALVLKNLRDAETDLPDPASAGALAPLLSLCNDLIKANRTLSRDNQHNIKYIRQKVNQLLEVMGTVPLRPDELDDRTLLELDPIGIVARSFSQILEHQRQTNKKLALAMEEIRAIFEAVGGGLLVVDMEMRIQACNKNFKKMFLQEDEKVIGAHCHDIVCRNSALVIHCPFKKMLTDGREIAIDNWSIGERHFNIIAQPVRNSLGEVVSGVLLYLDITEELQARLDLAAEKERLAVTLASIAEGVIATDVDDRVIMMNTVAEELCGWKFKKAEGRPSCEVFWAVDEEVRHTCLYLSAEVLKKGSVVERSGNTVLISQDGSERLIHASAAPINDKNGDIIGVVLVFRDITEEKNREKEIINARRLESLGVLAGGLAHDFNNLLTGILGHISLAGMTVERNSRLAERLQQAEKACLRARDLTQQLLTFARGGTPVKKITSITELLKETTFFALRGSPVEAVFKLAEDLWPVNVDEGQIAQVINNLTINAKQAMPDGGVLTVRTQNKTIGPDSSLPLESGAYISISLTDTGTGIAPKQLGLIFDPYFTTKPSGSGLGLASSYAIVKKHEGHITVKSRLGKGTTFTIYLKASPQAATVPEPQIQSEVPEHRTGRVLIMDDEKLITDLASEFLSEEGFEVAVAADGAEAVEKYRQALAAGQKFDVVITDLTVPGGMGGKEAMRLLLSLDPEVKAIVSSGYSSDAVMSSFLEFGFKAVMPKPYQAATLLKIVQDVLAGK